MSAASEPNPYRDEIVVDAKVLSQEAYDFAKKFGSAFYGTRVAFNFDAYQSATVIVEAGDKYVIDGGKVKK